jgi:predicted lipoprotein
MRYSVKKVLVGFLLVTGVVVACKKDSADDGSNNGGEKFDRKSMLTNIGNNLIIPAYQKFYDAVLNFDSSVIAFNQNPDANTLVTVQQNFKLAYGAWEFCDPYGFGPADQHYLGKSVNTFPTDVTQINANISSGSYDLNAILNMDAKGLPAFDYLLFGVGNENETILVKYTTDADAAKRKQYLTNLSADLKSKIAVVLSEWKGGYLQTFNNNTGTDIGSSTSYLYNEFLKSYEAIKNYKFGIPLGRMSGQTAAYPDKVEAYYSGISSDLANHHWKCIKNIWEGRGLNGVNGVGFQEYLLSVEGGDALNTQTVQQQGNVEAAYAGLPAGKLSDAITQQFDKVDAVHTELQKMTRFYKSDLSSLLGITITFSSGDGD